MKRKVKAMLSKVNFFLGRTPKIAKGSNMDYLHYIPAPYKAVVLISADFELAWAWRFAKSSRNPKQEAINRARIERGNIPKILELCDKYSIPITWATVGHLLLEKCDKNGHVPHRNLNRIPYHENKYWRFSKGEWFNDDPCTDWKTSPEWYAPDLVSMILDSKAKHEIACHSFSHIDCRDEVCPPQVFISEIRECQNLAQEYGIRLQSFVHPGHTIGHLNTLKELGFTSFRTDNINTLGYPINHGDGFWEIQSTGSIDHRLDWSDDYYVNRLIKIIDRAVENKCVAYLWFHPSLDQHMIKAVLEPFLAYIFELQRKRQIIASTTQEYVHYLNENTLIDK